MKDYTNRDWLYQKYVVKNHTQREIADICGLKSGNTIGNYIKKFNIKKKNIRDKDHLIVGEVFESNNYGKFKVLKFHSKCDNSNVRKYLVEFLDTKSQNVTTKRGIIEGDIADISLKNKEVFCEVCGISSKEVRVNHWSKYNKTLCVKHYDQLRNNGTILKRTNKDPNEIILYDNYAEIVCYYQQEKGKESIEKGRLIIDLDDVEKCKKYKWQITNYGYGKTTLKNKKHLSIHRYIMGYYGELEVDHKNRNPSNNRKCNLRISENYNNAVNKGVRKKNTSRITGVCWNENRNKWISRISYRGKDYNLGRFDNKEEAIRIRLNAEVKYFGEYAPQKHLFKQYGVDIYE